jgi:ADP-heptose:LPS heptosyltransferase
VLLIRYDRLGDMVITTPVIDALRQLAPQAEIDVLASRANASLLEADPRVRNVFIWGGSFVERLRVIRRCRRRRYDAAFQLILGRTTLPAILTAILTPRGRTIGKTMIDHDFLFNHAVAAPEPHFSERTLALVRRGIDGADTLPSTPYSIYIPDDARRSARRIIADAHLPQGGFILLNISAGNPDREQTHDRNVEMARRLAALGIHVGVVGTPDAWERAKRIAENAGAAPLRFGSLLELAACMAHARIVVTPDTGTLHLAAAVGAPVVAMFPATGHPEGWAPRGVPSRVIQATHGTTMNEVDIDAVVAAAREILGGMR